MCKTSRAIWVVVAVLAASPVFADDDVRTAALSRSPESASKAGQADERSASGQRDAAIETGNVDTASARVEPTGKLVESRGGLHWANDGQRPVLQYQFSDTAVMRIRGAGGGGAVSFNWKF